MNMLEKRDQWLRHTGVNPDFEAVRATLEDSLQTLILAALQRLRGSFDEDIASEITLLRELDRFPEARLEDLDRLEDNRGSAVDRNGTWRKAVSKNHGFPPGHPLKPRMEQLLARLQQNDSSARGAAASFANCLPRVFRNRNGRLCARPFLS